VQAIDAGLLVLVDFTEMVAYDHAGKRWRTGRISSDGIRIDETDAQGIWGMAWDASQGKRVEFFVDAKTGNCEGGVDL
jgi:hypothetical protein